MLETSKLKLKIYEGGDFPHLPDGYNPSMINIDTSLGNAGSSIPLAKAKAEEALKESANALTEIEKLESSVNEVVQHEATQDTELRELLDQSSANTVKYHEGNDKLDEISSAMPTDAIMAMWDDSRIYYGNCRVFKNYDSIENEITFNNTITSRFNVDNLKIKYKIKQPPTNKFLNTPTKGFLELTISGYLGPNVISGSYINTDVITLYLKDRRYIKITDPVQDFVDNFKLEYPMILGQFLFNQMSRTGDWPYVVRACTLILNTNGALYLEVPTASNGKYYYPANSQYAQRFMSTNPYVQVFAMTMKD